MSGEHCPSCTCERRAPTQRDKRAGKPDGSVTWAEHLEAFIGYAARYGTAQSAERLASRGGFGYGELITFLGHEPRTWLPIPDTQAGPS